MFIFYNKNFKKWDYNIYILVTCSFPLWASSHLNKNKPSLLMVGFIQLNEKVICSVVPDSLQPHGLQPARLLCPWNSPAKNTGVSSCSLLQGIFQTQGLNPGLLHWGWILYGLSHLGKPKNTGVGSLSLLQGIFPIQESNQGLLHGRWIFYWLSYRGSPQTSKAVPYQHPRNPLPYVGCTPLTM